MLFVLLFGALLGICIGVCATVLVFVGLDERLDPDHGWSAAELADLARDETFDARDWS